MGSYDPAVAIPSLIGSLLSCVASGSIFLCYTVLPHIPHFRHILIINLAVADFINSLNNSISGVYVFAAGEITPGDLCTLNGLIGQFSAQAVDFAILLMAFVTVFALRGATFGLDLRWHSQVILLGCVWIMPVVTSLTALGLRAYAPVSGNWCWISSEKPVLRYALAHGWRFLIVLITASLYSYLFFYLRSRFRVLRNCQQPSNAQVPHPTDLSTIEDECPSDDDELEMRCRGVNSHSPDDGPAAVPSSKTLTNIMPCQQSLTSPTNDTPLKRRLAMQRKQSEIYKALLLNAYPIAYVLLWLPGIINRFVELTGHSSRPLQILQATSQYIGLANAITYGLNEGIKRQLGIRWKKRKGLLPKIASKNRSII